NDLTKSEPVFPYVNYLVAKNLLKGYPDGSFRPASSITRAEITALLARASGLTGQKPATPTFKDLGPGHWAYETIETAARAGLVRGYPDGSFRPDAPVTRAEASALLLRLTKESLPAVTLPEVVKDVNSGHWAWRQVAAVLDAGLLTMAAKNSFAPDLPATRAQVARGLAIMLNISPERLETPLTGKLAPLKGEVILQEADQGPRRITAETACGAGATIKTGPDGRAELKFPDGSGLRIEANTEFTIKKARGQATILRDGSPGAMVDFLELDLPKGKIFGALASPYFYRQEEEKTKEQRKSAALNSFQRAENIKLLALASRIPADIFLAQIDDENTSGVELPWWKSAFAKRVRVRVDMPWGVAGIRGTFWMNEVTATHQSTSVLVGSVEVTSAGQTVVVPAGQATVITSAAAPPAPPAKMAVEQQKAWVEVKEWVEERATAIQNSAPVVSPPVPAAQQVTPEAPGALPEVSLPPVPEVITQVASALTEAASGAESAPSPPPSGGGGGGGGAPSPVQEPARLAKVVLSGSIPVLQVGGTHDLTSLTLAGRDQYGNSYDISQMSVTWSVDNIAVATVSGNILTALAPGDAKVSAILGGITSNSLAFKVTTPPDTTPPVVVSTDPVNGATSVPVSKTITITFSENVQPGDNIGKIALKSGATVTGFACGVDGTKLIIIPESNLVTSVTYAVYIPAGAVKDMAGNPLAADYSFSFSTAQPEETPMPSIPAAYYGSVTINGSPALVGTVIKAMVDGVEEGMITITEAGIYGDQSAGGNKLIVGASGNVKPGSTVTFSVDNVKASESIVFRPGDIKRVDLTVSVK
ncbi:MAG: S-layer homology domain-containing protein, partial [Bacillota bacterium]